MVIEHQWAGILEWSLKHSIERDFLSAIAAFRTLFKHLKVDYPEIAVTEDSSIASAVESMMKRILTPQQAQQIQTAFETLRYEIRIYWEKEMKTIIEHFWQEGHQDGRLEGRTEAAKLMLDAIALLKQGASTEQAAQDTCLSPEIIECLYQQLQSQGTSSSVHR